MPLPSRKRASLVLLLILAAGLAGAGAAEAASLSEMGCCPAGMQSAAGGCTWLGASDCCAERPAAQPATSAAPPAPACLGALPLPASTWAPTVLPTRLSHALRPPPSSVLRL